MKLWDRNTIQDILSFQDSHKNKIFHMSSVWCSLQESALSFVKFCVHLDKHLFFFGGGAQGLFFWVFLILMSSFFSPLVDKGMQL